MVPEKAEENVSKIFHLYEQYGQSDYIGEPLSQLEHMLQAAHLAAQAGYDDEVILAALFHDIGHLTATDVPSAQMGEAGVADHEIIGARLLEEAGFSIKTVALVQSHVPAKRYLTYKYPDYLERLSPASQETLRYQGGTMSAAEADSFERDPHFELYIKLREWDDEAKDPGKPVPPIEHYRSMAVAHLTDDN